MPRENPLQPFLEEHGYLVLDGALATELERRGANLDDSLWSARILLENPNLIREVHYDYFVAGADVAITASYQATFAGFARRGLDQNQATEILRLSVDLACQARDRFWSDPANRAGRRRPLVAASIGPYGAYLADGGEYRGDYGLSREELMDFHRRRMAVLAASPADLLACETIPCLLEGEALVRLLGEFPRRGAWLSFSCRDDEHVSHGETLRSCAALAERSDQVLAVGLNCTPPRHVEPLLRSTAGVTQKPLVAYPNSGESWDAVAHSWVAGSRETGFANAAPAWFAAGARLIGGCCRTTPDDIGRVRQILSHSVRT